MSKAPVFPQLARLIRESNPWTGKPGQRYRPEREIPLDEIFTPDGVPTIKGEDDDI